MLERPASSATAALESQGRQGTSTGDGARKTPPSVLGHGGAELSGCQLEVEAVLSSSSILPAHRAMLGMVFTQFRSAEAGILEVFLGLAKGFEVSVLYVFHLTFIVMA